MRKHRDEEVRKKRIRKQRGDELRKKNGIERDEELRQKGKRKLREIEENGIEESE